MANDSTVNFDNIPKELRSLEQWVVWGVNSDKPKMPFTPQVVTPPAVPALQAASAGQPKTWRYFGNARHNVENGFAKGIGFEFDPQPIQGTDLIYYGIDLDKVLNEDGSLMAGVDWIVSTLDSYTEISPSGTGLHIFVKAQGVKLEANRKGFIEIYNKERYFTMTGNVYGELKPIQERTEQLQAVYDKYLKPEDKPADRPRIAQNNDYQNDRDFLKCGLENDQILKEFWLGARPNGNESADDQGFINKLTYWCNGNESLIETAFLNSPYYSQKDNQHQHKCDRKDYLPRTIKKAVNGLSSTAEQDNARYKTEQARKDFASVSNSSIKQQQNQAHKPLRIRRISDIEAKAAESLFDPYIPANTLSIIAGQPGSTKTWFSLYMAALISNGGEFLTDNPFIKREPGIVIYQSKENDYSTVVRPRLDTLGANLDNIIMIDDHDEDGNGMPLTLTDGRLEDAIKEYKPALVILDPIQSYLGAGMDMHRANEVRPLMDKLLDIAERHKCAIVLVMHFSKMSTVGALDRILGSADFRAAARSICIVGSDPQDFKRRVIAHAKYNNGEYGESIAYRITQHGVEIEGFCDLDADTIVSPNKKEGRDKPSVTLEAAKDFLLGLFGEDGYIKADDAKQLALNAGISDRTLYRVKIELKLQSHSLGFGANKITWWTLPDREPPCSPNKVEQTEQTRLPISTEKAAETRPP